MIHGKKACFNVNEKGMFQHQRQNAGTNVPEFLRQRLEICLFPVDHHISDDPWHRMVCFKTLTLKFRYIFVKLNLDIDILKHAFSL